MEVNKIHNINFLDNTLPDKCANLIIADPPYFEVKGSFDFVWKSFDDYLIDVEKWAKECKRLLADNGTLFWYGHAKNIAYSQVILDEHFELINNLVWEKTDCQTKKGIEEFRMFAPITERILMYSNGDDYHETVRLAILDVQNYLNTITTRDFLAKKLLDCGNCKNYESAKQNANNILSQKSAKPQLITEQQYNLIDDNNKKPYSEIVLMYSYQKAIYEQKRRVFENSQKLTDVLRFSQQAHITGNYDHETCKPEHLTRSLILTCSRPNDFVVVPFAGSGTECAMAVKEGRKSIGFEITEKYAKMSNDRVQNILRQPSLFAGS
jgi:site-specific DNA-methyltransferase (adenine-specific)